MNHTDRVRTAEDLRRAVTAAAAALHLPPPASQAEIGAAVAPLGVLSQALRMAGFNGLAALAAMAERAEVPLEVLSLALRMAGFNGLAAAVRSLPSDTPGASLEGEAAAPVEQWERLPQPRACRGGVLIGDIVHEADRQEIRAAAIKFARGCVTPLSEPLAHVKGGLSGTGVGKFWRKAVAVCDLVAADRAAEAQAKKDAEGQNIVWPEGE